MPPLCWCGCCWSWWWCILGSSWLGSPHSSHGWTSLPTAPTNTPGACTANTQTQTDPATTFLSMIVSVGVSLLAGQYSYYATLIWTAIAIAYFEVRSSPFSSMLVSPPLYCSMVVSVYFPVGSKSSAACATHCQSWRQSCEEVSPPGDSCAAASLGALAHMGSSHVPAPTPSTLRTPLSLTNIQLWHFNE